MCSWILLPNTFPFEPSNLMKRKKMKKKSKKKEYNSAICRKFIISKY